MAGLVGKSGAADWILSLLANDFFIPAAMALIGAGLWFVGKTRERRRQNQWGFIYAVSGLGITALIVNFIDNHSFRARPYVNFPQLIPQVHKLFYEPTVSSFPAFPAAVTFAFAFGIWLTNRKVGTVLFVMAALMSISRIFIGIHYPTDILAGAAMGIAVTLVLWQLFRYPLKPLANFFLALLERLYLA
jgi:undecaprenyl-diphosphatase